MVFLRKGTGVVEREEFTIIISLILKMEKLGDQRG